METGAEHRYPAQLDMAVFAVKARLLRIWLGLRQGRGCGSH